MSDPTFEEQAEHRTVPITKPTQTGEVRPSHPGYHPPVPARDHSTVKQSHDRAQYVRNQKGHSLILHLLLGAFVVWINVLYISFSPNHYWHA